ncbi:unnamed protein product [Microthlaspi erraticum]|uniref:CBF1-interacting co-repressor CIR N-terminal domain-containing protein n=1 Tax=Microthlaspi erraticum TaxID=1685480 RepID=A0A6D2KFF6_9BRAS|nr:unnamed protein product [Microthlaspi erraticum]CAA7050768.1 unnamed protein product [Microthlaspi erraticum]
MALKFLNKKGWHTGSLRNIEKVWKAEQKQEAEEKRLEEIRLQIQQEKERSEFHAMMEQSGLVPNRPERLEFMYDPVPAAAVATENANRHGVRFQNQHQRSNNKKQKQSVPGALFDDKTHFANDSWRKSHSDPLLLIRQQELEARKSVKEKRNDKDGEETMEYKRKHMRRV